MENILDKINEAYKKGIENPRFQAAISEIIKEPEKDESRNKSNREIQERATNREISVDESKVFTEINGRDSQGEER